MPAPRVALVTCADLPDLDADDRLVLEPLGRLGVVAEPAVWDDAGVDWSSYHVVLLRNPWDYARRRAEFLAWARAVARLHNPVDVVAWNTDKRYLRDLAAAGLPVVPTTWLEPGDEVVLPRDGEHVVKPSVGAGSVDVARYDLGEPGRRDAAVAHAQRLLGAGRTVMVQPYLSAVDTAGETALLFLGGRYSHAIRKDALLAPDGGEVDGLYREERISAREPSAPELALAERVLDAVPGGRQRLAYARVDLVPGADGAPVVLELEVTEPSLFLGFAPGAAQRLADVVVELAG